MEAKLDHSAYAYPWGDSERYDSVVTLGHGFLRVPVKSATRTVRAVLPIVFPRLGENGGDPPEAKGPTILSAEGLIIPIAERSRTGLDSSCRLG